MNIRLDSFDLTKVHTKKHISSFKTGPLRAHFAIARFTLVEMLVVIAIICILTSLLMPQLKGAISSARQVSCAQNLKSMNWATMSYADENHNYMPQGYYRNWINDLNTYLDYPSDFSSKTAWQPPHGPYFCPETDPYGQDPLFGTTGTNYDTFKGEPGLTSYAPLRNWYHNNGVHLRMNTFKPTCALAFDAHMPWVFFKLVIPIMGGNEPADTAKYEAFDAPYWRHNGGANLMFLDGRVKAFQFTGTRILRNDYTEGEEP